MLTFYQSESNYLKLECTTSSSTATVGQVKDMGVLEVRLYCPSVNRWGGKKVRTRCKVLFHKNIIYLRSIL